MNTVIRKNLWGTVVCAVVLTGALVIQGCGGTTEPDGDKIPPPRWLGDRHFSGTSRRKGQALHERGNLQPIISKQVWFSEMG